MLKVVEYFKTNPAESQTAASLYTPWTIGFELAEKQATSDLAATVFESALASPFVWNSLRIATERNPIHGLVELRPRDQSSRGRRKSLLELARSDTFPERYDPGMIREMRMAGLPHIGRELVRLGFPADAVPLLQEALAARRRPGRTGRKCGSAW